MYAYLVAQFWHLPDGRINGIYDAMSIIRAKHFDLKHPRELLLKLDPTDFEYLVAYLFYNMDYDDIKMTKRSHDGGRDIIARKNKTGSKELNLIQCKRVKGNVEVKFARRFTWNCLIRKSY